MPNQPSGTKKRNNENRLIAQIKKQKFLNKHNYNEINPDKQRNFAMEQHLRFKTDIHNSECPLTVWTNWNEWLYVKQLLVNNMQEALSTLSLWRQKYRDQVPVIIETTFYLVEGLIITSNNSSVKEQMLSNAIVRFVNLFSNLSSKQGVGHMSVNTTIADCPKILLDIRNQISHKRFPHLELLICAAKQALMWLKLRYWDKQEAQIEEYQTNWLNDCKKIIPLLLKKKEIEEREVTHKKERVTKLTQLNNVEKDINTTVSSVVSELKGPNLSFLLETFIMKELLVINNNNSKRKKGNNDNFNTNRQLLDLLDSHLDFSVGLLRTIIIIVRDFEIYSSKYDISQKPMTALNIPITLDMIEICFVYFDKILTNLSKTKEKVKLSVDCKELIDFIKINETELMQEFLTRLEPYHQEKSNTNNNTPIFIPPGCSGSLILSSLLVKTDIDDAFI
ncbi:hypothetical protein ABK040_006674 [Willaertia magna]